MPISFSVCVTQESVDISHSSVFPKKTVEQGLIQSLVYQPAEKKVKGLIRIMQWWVQKEHFSVTLNEILKGD